MNSTDGPQGLKDGDAYNGLTVRIPCPSCLHMKGKGSKQYVGAGGEVFISFIGNKGIGIKKGVDGRMHWNKYNKVFIHIYRHKLPRMHGDGAELYSLLGEGLSTGQSYLIPGSQEIDEVGEKLVYVCKIDTVNQTATIVVSTSSSIQEAADKCPQPPPMTSLFNRGQDCWEACGEKGGFCDWCGSGYACCHGSGTKSYDPIECQGATGGAGYNKHVCVKPAATVPPSPPSAPVLVGCYRAQGRDYTGSANTTVSGLTCQDWESSTPHNHYYKAWTLGTAVRALIEPGVRMPG